MDIEKLINGILNAPMSNVIGVIVIILMLILWRVVKAYFPTKIKTWSESILTNKESKRIAELEYHDVFTTIRDVRQLTNKVVFYTDGELDVTKGRMFSDFMNYKLDAVRDSFLHVIIKAVKARNHDHLKSIIQDAVGNSIREYMLKTENHFLRSGVPLADAKYAIELFEEWREETVKSVKNEIQNIFASRFHKTKYDRLLAVLQVLSMAISLIPKDGKAAFNSMNGKFKQIKYKTR